MRKVRKAGFVRVAWAMAALAGSMDAAAKPWMQVAPSRSAAAASPGPQARPAAAQGAPDAAADRDDLLERTYPVAQSPAAAEALVANAIALAGELQAIGDLRRALVEQRLGITFLAKSDAHAVMPKRPGESEYFWNQRVTRNWWFVNVSFDDTRAGERPTLDLGFLNLKGQRAMTGACADLYAVAPDLARKYGYGIEPVGGSDADHVQYLRYRRATADSPVIELYPAHETPDAPEAGKTCVYRLVVR